MMIPGELQCRNLTLYLYKRRLFFIDMIFSILTFVRSLSVIKISWLPAAFESLNGSNGLDCVCNERYNYLRVRNMSIDEYKDILLDISSGFSLHDKSWI
jgi:hypothetical protein